MGQGGGVQATEREIGFYHSKNSTVADITDIGDQRIEMKQRNPVWSEHRCLTIRVSIEPLTDFLTISSST